MIYPSKDNITKVLFFKIETAPISLQPTEAWNEKDWLQEAGFSPEFGQIICFSFGYFKNNKSEYIFKKDKSEKEILVEAFELINKTYDKGNILCNNNLKWTLPFINRKAIKYGLQIPYPFRTFLFKPWEMDFLIDLSTFMGFNGIAPPLSEVYASYGLKPIDFDNVPKMFFVEEKESLNNLFLIQIKLIMALYKKIILCV